MEPVHGALDGIVGQQGGVFILLALLGGILGRPMISWLKERFGLDDRRALALALGVSFALAIVHALIMGWLMFETSDPAQLIAAVGMIYSTAQVIFKWLQTGVSPEYQGAPPPV